MEAIESQEFIIPLYFVPREEWGAIELDSMRYICKILIPKNCPHCNHSLVLKEGFGGANTFDKPCKCFITYNDVSAIRIKTYDNCTKCGFDYPYGGPAVCKQCEMWKVIGS